MARVLYANNAKTTLAGAISSTATSCNLASGTGALFPSITPGSGNYFCMTFNDAATGLVFEIVHVTAITGDVCTIVRGQEGTTSANWLSGDFAENLWTAGSAQALYQAVDVQAQAGNYAVDTSSTANIIVAALNPAVTSLSNIIGSPVRVMINNTTTSTTVYLNLNSNGNVPVLLSTGTAPTIGALVAGAITEFIYNGTDFQIVVPPTFGTAATKAASNNSDQYVASVNSATTGHFVTFADGNGSLADGGAPGQAAYKAVSNNTLAEVASVSGSTTLGHFAVFADVYGTVEDGGAQGSASHANASSSTGTVAAVSGTIAAGHKAVFSDTYGTVSDGGQDGTAAAKAASNNADNTLASVTNPGLIVAGNVAIFADANGTVQDSGSVLRSAGTLAASSTRYGGGVSTVYTYAGNPNGNVPGYASTSTTSPDFVWDSTDSLLWVCTNTGSASIATWEPAVGGLGVSQTWQNMTSSRVLGTTYTNGTPKPICVALTGYHTGNGTCSVTVGGVVLSESWSSSSSPQSASAIVPPGASYTGGDLNLSLTSWYELR